jgi:hypothetical protein
VSEIIELPEDNISPDDFILGTVWGDLDTYI